MNASVWGTHPASGEWNTAANWNPAVVPTSTATFETSSQTAITFSSKSAATVNKIEFADGAPSYTFTFSSPATSKSALTIAGEGVFNSSTNIQSFVVASFSADGTEPQLKFTKSATAGGSNLSYSAGPA